MSVNPKTPSIPGLIAQDEEAVAELLELYWARAYRVALQLTGDPGAADDVAQETFVAVLKGISRLRSGDRFRGWFFKILENTARKHRRGDHRRSAHESQIPLAPTAAQDPQDAAQREEHIALLRRHLAGLSPKLRGALTLRFLEGMSLEEVAQVLDIPRKTVSSRIRLGLDSLKASLQPALSLSMIALPEWIATAMSVAAPEAPALIEIITALGAASSSPVPKAARPKELIGRAARRGRWLTAAGALTLTGIVATLLGLSLAPPSTDEDRSATAEASRWQSLALQQSPARDTDETKNQTERSKTAPGEAEPAEEETKATALPPPAKPKAPRAGEGKKALAGLAEPAGFAIRVVDERDQPIPGAALSLEPISEEAAGRGSGASDESGAAILIGPFEPGRFRLRCEKPGFAALSAARVITEEPTPDLSGLSAEEIKALILSRHRPRGKELVLAKRRLGSELMVELGAEELNAGITIKLLEAKLSIAGRVLDPGGAPVAGAAVLWRNISASGRTMATQARTLTDASGRFRLSSAQGTLRLGLVELVAKHEKWAYGREIFELTGTQRSKTATITLAPPCEIRGRLFASSGSFSVGRVEAVPASTERPSPADRRYDSFSGRRVSVEVGPDGAFTLGRLPPGKVDLIGLVPGYQAAIKQGVRVQAGLPTTVDLHVEKGLAIEGAFADAEGNPIRSSGMIYYQRAGDRRAPRRMARFQSAERFEIEGLEPGDYTIQLRCRGFAGIELSRVAAGNHNLRVTLVRSSALRLRLKSAGKRRIRSVKYMLMRGRGGRGSTAHIGREGVLLLGGIDASIERIELTASGHRPVTLKLQSPLAPGELRTLTVTLQPIPGAAEEEFPEDPAELERLLRKKRGKGAQELIMAIRKEAVQGNGHPPKKASPRTDLLPVLAAALEHPEQQVRVQGVLSLAYMRNAEGFPLLKKALGDADDTVRYYAVMGLGWLHDEASIQQEVVAIHEAIYKDKSRPLDTRLSAAQSLAEWGELADPAIFFEALRTPQGNAAMAAEALAVLKRRDALALLIKRLATARPSTDYHISVALTKLTGRSFGTDHLRWKAWLEANRALLPEQMR